MTTFSPEVPRSSKHKLKRCGKELTWTKTQLAEYRTPTKSLGGRDYKKPWKNTLSMRHQNRATSGPKKVKSYFNFFTYYRPTSLLSISFNGFIRGIS